jgi:CoA:oxalate CoA-transferase
MSEKPLLGIVVIDLTRVLAGPYCTMILKDLGADVIKVETPEVGDDARHFGPFLNGDKDKSAYFISINCGKKSVTLNLKDSTGTEVFSDLVRHADVLVENYRPGTLTRLGFPREKLSEINPSLVYASASGFGHSGSDSEMAAYDMIIQARSGLMSITGTEEGESVRVGSSICDIVTGMYTATGIIAALYRREVRGIGARVDVAMLDSAVSVLENAIARYQSTGESPRPLGSRHPSITPFEQFATRDSQIVIAAGNDKLFAALTEVLGRPALVSDERFETNALRTEHHVALKDEIERVTSRETTDHWLESLSTRDVPCAKINDIADLFDDRQVADREMLVGVEGESGFKVAGSPIKIADVEKTDLREHAPSLGEHTEEVLGSLLGYGGEKLRELRNRGVIT